MTGKRIARAAAALMLSAVLTVCSGCAWLTTRPPTGREFGFQLDPPKKGEEIAVMHTSHGDLYIRFFEKEAPKAVENFKVLAKAGYYDGVIFHRVLADFMIQSGDPTGSGNGGTSCWGGTFEDEFAANLGNLRGALSMANYDVDTNGSQFFINQAGPDAEHSLANLRTLYDSNEDNRKQYATFAAFAAARLSLDEASLTDEVLALYEEVGGNIHLDGTRTKALGNTVFGQVFDGMDVVDTIAAVETNEDGLPTSALVCIDSIEFQKYQG